ncbi:MAG: hypothetical protein V4519_03410 [Patescibacteria group bacterium]
MTALERQDWLKKHSSNHMTIIMLSMFGGGGIAALLSVIWKESYYLIGLILLALVVDIAYVWVIDILATKELKVRAARAAPPASTSTPIRSAPSDLQAA